MTNEDNTAQQIADLRRMVVRYMDLYNALLDDFLKMSNEVRNKEGVEGSLKELQNRHDRVFSKMIEQTKEIEHLKRENKRLELNVEHLNAQAYINKEQQKTKDEAVIECIKKLQAGK